jgi:hypothetical protein
MSLETTGRVIGKIPVRISYKIIELFSAGLYSSPNKAFEELVSNSYDAGATKVSVYVPLDKTQTDATLWVADNGISMDKEELKDFWEIGTSKKRIRESKSRPPIGKFGIGKLATYILTTKLTLICKAKDGRFYAVTMNYSTVNQGSRSRVTLDERELTLTEVQDVLHSLITVNGIKLLNFELWGKRAEDTWTFIIMSDLKPKAHEIKDGRLNWILRTALPLNPNFNLMFNGTKLKSTKEAVEPLETWIFGKDDAVAEKFAYDTCKKGEPCINLPNLKGVRGRIDLYRDSLLKGKSEEMGRSNGIFLNIRKRLVNIDDPLLGMAALSHGVFNRTRIIVNADNLDQHLTSTRESIRESAALSELRQYILRKFLEVKDWYFAYVQTEGTRSEASHKIALAPASLSRRPLLITARKFFAGDISDLVLIDIPADLSRKAKEAFIAALEDDLTSERGIIQKVEWVALDPEDPIAKLDLSERTARINLMHPFFANFIDEVKSPLPFQLFALTEILTEALLVESDLSGDEIRNIMTQRDAILRELTFSDRPNAPLVASMLQASLGNPGGLEAAVTSAFSALGFEASPIGGNNEPDGKAIAHIAPMGSTSNYSLTFDAKSTSKKKIKAGTARVSAADRHRTKYNAEYASVVAIDFEAGDIDDGAVNLEAKKLKVNLIRAKDLMALILLSGPKQVGLNELQDFFQNCHTVNETSAWIGKIRKKEVNRGPIKELVHAVFDLNKSDREPATLTALRQFRSELKPYSVKELRTMVESLQKLVPGYLSIQKEVVSINAKPEKILAVLNSVVTTDVPAEFLDIYMKAFKID